MQPSTLRMVKFSVAVMSFLLIAGFGVLLWGLWNVVTDNKTTVTSAWEQNLEGFSIQHTELDEDHLMLWGQTPSGQSRILIFAIDSGEKIGEVVTTP